MDELAIVRAYHQRSKHALRRYAAGPETLDWDAQPDPWRRWDGAPLQPLPLLPALDSLPATTPTWAQLARPGAVAPRPLDATAVGALLQLSLGLSAWKQQGPDRWAVRCNPSSGNLHPTEAWVLTRRVSGLPDGLHHYAPREHALAQRALLAPAGAGATPGLWVALSSIHWREAWKYGERAFRYCQLDLGHALGALRLAAAVLGWRAELRPTASADLGALLGLDRDADFGLAERESPECLVQLLPAGDDAAADAPQPTQLHGWAGRANRLDCHPMYRWPLIDEVDAATRWLQPPAAVAAPAPAPAPASLSPTQPASDASKTDEAGPGAIALITRRRSAQRFDRRATLPLATLAALLAACKPGAAPPLDLWPQAPRVHLVVFAHRVDDLPSGAYLMPRGAGATLRLRPLLAPEADWTAVKGLPLLRLAENPALAGTLRTLCCHQALASDAVLAVAMLAEFDAALAADGAPAYRTLLQEAGLLGHALYLQAEALGWRGTGIGCFFDDALHELLAVQGTALQSLYHFSIGAPVIDERVATTPPYAHLAAPAATPPSPSLAQESSAMTPPKTFTRLRPDEAAAWLAARPQALRLDAREARHFGAGHLPGSLRLDGRNHEALLMGQPRSRPVFITCYHGNASQTYAQMFVDFGFADVADLVDGMAAWPAAGLIGADAPPSTAPASPTPAAAPTTATAAAPSPALAAWLADQGLADAHQAGRHGNTALMQAAWQNRADLVDELLALGVDPHAANGDGNTALWLACVANNPALVQRLVAAGLAIDHANLTGATALMYAASSSKPAIVQTLLALGADPLLTTQDDFSALDMAASLECLQLLRAATRAPRSVQAAVAGSVAG